MKVDWNVETEGGGHYQPGVYTVRIEEITEVEAKSSGNMQLRIKSKFVGGPYDNKQLTEHITLVPSCGWKLVKFIKAMGVVEDVKTLGEMDTDSGKFRGLLNKLIGKTTCWNVEVVKSQAGKDVNDVVDYQPDPDAEKWEGEGADEPEFLRD